MGRLGPQSRMTATRRWLAGLLAVILTTACMPADEGSDTALQQQAAPQPEDATDRQLAGARRQLGLGLEAAGDYGGAVDEFIAALAQGDWSERPESGSFEDTPLGDLARICGRGEPEAAVVRACTRVIASFRFSSARLAGFLVNRADAYLRLNEPDRAMADYETVLEIETSNPRGLSGRARVRARAGDHPAALQDFRRAIDGGFDTPQVRYDRALSWAAIGDFEAAIADFDHIISDPEGVAMLPEAYRGRAEVHCRIGRADAAAIGWQVWLDLTPGGVGHVRDMLMARGYSPGPASEGFSPVALAALRDWTRAGCPGNGPGIDPGAEARPR